VQSLLVRDVRDLRRGDRQHDHALVQHFVAAKVARECGWLCHRTLTTLQNYYTKVSKIRMPVLAMATSSSQGGTRCVLKTPYLMQQQSLQQAY